MNKEILFILKRELLIVGLLFAIYTDIKYGKIYNKFNLIFFLVGFFLNLLEMNIHFIMNTLLGSFIAFIIFFIFFQIGEIGGGDVKLMASLGVWVGFPSILWVIFFTSVSGAVYAIILYIFKKHKKIPYSIAIATGVFLWTCITGGN